MNKILTDTIITAHTNADFDALAAMIAASKLYPGAALIFPGSQEKNIRNFFIQSATYLYNFKTYRDINPQNLKTLVMVDTRQKSRVPHVAQAFDVPGLKIEVYDHHPDSDDDVRADKQVLKFWGSTTAILVEEIRNRELKVSPDEATILGLGIYEDTGSFTFNSTTEHDLAAAAWLRAQGMDVNVIADLLVRELSAEQITIMSSLIESASAHEINHVEVVIAEASTEEYVGDFALLAHKLMDMQNIRVLFALGRMKDRVHIVARSRSQDVDVGRICASLGGGGHPFAASASVKDKPLAQVKEELFGLLYSQINPQILVRQLMSHPAVGIDEKEPINLAVDILTRYGLKAMPVLKHGTQKCAGILDRDIADKALKHGLGEVEVGEYMMRDAASVSPETDLYPVMEIVLGQRQRLVPVVENEAVTGVVTRTDLINFLIREPARIPESLLPEKKRERNISPLLRERLPKSFLELLHKAGKLAEQSGFEVYAVGGFVRDIMLAVPNLDLDLVVEGDGIAFAELMVNTLGGRIKSHPKFKTAVVILPDGQRVDVATARLEYYEYPAALPIVELSSIKMDLYRRDFTINSLAVQLNPGSFGRLVDFFGGAKDIKDRIIRSLHSLSFVEDPTRMLRAIRFEQRYNFRIGAQTDRLMKNAVGLSIFAKLSGSRVFHEIRLILDEAKALDCIRRMQQFKILAAIHPLLALTQSREAVLEEVQKMLTWYRLLYIKPEPESWRVYLLGLCAGLDDEQARVVTARLNFSKRHEREFGDLRQHIREASQKMANWEYQRLAYSELYFILESLPLEGLLYLMARNPKESVRKNISHYLTSLRSKKIDIRGDDLQKLGILPGPLYSQILRRVKAAKLDGLAESREDQLRLAGNLARQAFEDS